MDGVGLRDDSLLVSLETWYSRPESLYSRSISLYPDWSLENPDWIFQSLNFVTATVKGPRKIRSIFQIFINSDLVFQNIEYLLITIYFLQSSFLRERGQELSGSVTQKDGVALGGRVVLGGRDRLRDCPRPTGSYSRWRCKPLIYKVRMQLQGARCMSLFFNYWDNVQAVRGRERERYLIPDT